MKIVIIDGVFKAEREVGGVTIVPTKEIAEEYKKKDDVIVVNELIDKGCNKCYGRGYVGVSTGSVGISKKQLSEIIEYQLSKGNIKNLPDIVAGLTGMPENFKRPLELLFKVRLSGNTEMDAEEYAQMILDDFVPKKVYFCSCVVKGLEREIARRMTKKTPRIITLN